jgi:hypothetical protein
MAEKERKRSPFLRYEGPVLLPAIRFRKPQPKAPWFHLGGHGGPVLTLQDKMNACETLDQLNELWDGAKDAHDWGAVVIQPEDVQRHLERTQELTLGRSKRVAKR